MNATLASVELPHPSNQPDANATPNHEFAVKFAIEWVDAWNSHDLDRILSLYAADAELNSVFVPRILGTKATTLCGLAALRDYFGRALAFYPGLRFVLRRAFAGVQSVVVQYQSVEGKAATEMMEFNEAGEVQRVYVHYSAPADRV